VSQAQVIYQVKDWRVSVTRAAVRIGGKGRAGGLGTGCIQSVSESGMRIGTHKSTAEQLTGISMQ